MRRTLLSVAACAITLSTLPALDLDVSLNAGLGAAMALGGDLDAALAEFAAASGAEAYAAPVLGQQYGVGISAPLGRVVGAAAGMNIRRLGYAMWSPEAQAMTWLSLWTAGIRVGLTAGSGPLFAGAGFTVEAPVSGVSQSSGLGGAGVEIDYGTDSGRMLIPGGYLEAGLEFGKAVRAGRTLLYPRLALQVGAWPLGVLDGAESVQLSACLTAGFRLESGGVK